MKVRSPIEEGRAALRAGDAAAARRAFELAGTETADVVEGLARVAYLELDFMGAIDMWERAYGMYRAEGDPIAAIRVARQLGYMHGSFAGDWAVSQGWLARAQSLLDGTTGTSEPGWVALSLGMFEGDRAHKEALLREALAIAREHDDSALEHVARSYLGASLVHADRTADGMKLLDEALAAVAGGEVEDFSLLEEIFCQLFSACEYSHDVARADQWIRVGRSIAERRNFPAVSAFCHTHYGGVLTAAGRWSEADAALTEAARLWALGVGSTMRRGALVRLADLRVRQGRFEEAAQLLSDGSFEGDADAARPLATILLVGGDVARAAETAERALERFDRRSVAGAPLLALSVEVYIQAGRTDEAETAATELEACAESSMSDYARATAALARGQVCLARRTGDPRTWFREATEGFVRAQMPLEAARSRLELARVLADERPELAMEEARAALDVFERLPASQHAAAAAALLRSLGVRTVAGKGDGGPLTKRENEVLELLGHGLSNREIAERLFISPKTVEHHVGNVLSKLGLRNRAAAAAYFTRSKPGAI